jgi:hypothetical protein
MLGILARVMLVGTDHPGGRPVTAPAKVVEEYIYSGGYFATYSREPNPQWVEANTDGSAKYRFTETKRDKDWIYLFDGSRNMMLRLPVGGDPCFWSADEGRSWNRLYDVAGPMPGGAVPAAEKSGD